MYHQYLYFIFLLSFIGIKKLTNARQDIPKVKPEYKVVYLMEKEIFLFLFDLTPVPRTIKIIGQELLREYFSWSNMVLLPQEIIK